MSNLAEFIFKVGSFGISYLLLLDIATTSPFKNSYTFAAIFIIIILASLYYYKDRISRVHRCSGCGGVKVENKRLGIF